MLPPPPRLPSATGSGGSPSGRGPHHLAAAASAAGVERVPQHEELHREEEEEGGMTPKQRALHARLLIKDGTVRNLSSQLAKTVAQLAHTQVRRALRPSRVFSGFSPSPKENLPSSSVWKTREGTSPPCPRRGSARSAPSFPSASLRGGERRRQARLRPGVD